MIEEIVIRDLGVIGEARLQIGPGFTALTGETGAGKTMILTALGLLLGERADSASVRRGQDQAAVHGLWKLDPNSAVGREVSERLAEADVEFDPSELIISRTVGSDGKSRASISARPVPAGLLAELGEKLVVVHGQSEQMRLKSASAQREALDAFGGPALATLLQNYTAKYNEWRGAADRLNELTTQSDARTREADELRAAFDELEAAAIMAHARLHEKNRAVRIQSDEQGDGEEEQEHPHQGDDHRRPGEEDGAAGGVEPPPPPGVLVPPVVSVPVVPGNTVGLPMPAAYISGARALRCSGLQMVSTMVRPRLVLLSSAVKVGSYSSS